MRKKKLKFQKFEIPDAFLDQLFELTGGVDKNKGYFLCHVDEHGNCQIRHKYDSQVTEFAINKLIEIYLNQKESDRIVQSEDIDFYGEGEDDD